MEILKLNKPLKGRWWRISGRNVDILCETMLPKPICNLGESTTLICSGDIQFIIDITTRNGERFCEVLCRLGMVKLVDAYIDLVMFGVEEGGYKNG